MRRCLVRYHVQSSALLAGPSPDECGMPHSAATYKLADNKIAHVSLSSCTVARRIENIAVNIKTQLLERMVRSRGL